MTATAWQGVLRSPEIRAYFERTSNRRLPVRRGDLDRRKIALVAAAHGLARVMLAMLRSGQAARFTCNVRKAEQAAEAATLAAGDCRPETETAASAATAATAASAVTTAMAAA